MCRWGRLAEPGFLVALASGGPPDRTGFAGGGARARALRLTGAFRWMFPGTLDSLRSLRTGRQISLRVQDPAPILVTGRLIHEGDGVAAKALEALEIHLEGVRREVEKTVGPSEAAGVGARRIYVDHGLTGSTGTDPGCARPWPHATRATRWW